MDDPLCSPTASAAEVDAGLLHAELLFDAGAVCDAHALNLRAVAAGTALADDALACRAHIGAAATAYELRLLDEAAEQVAHALSRARRTAQDDLVARALLASAQLALRVDDTDQALADLDQAHPTVQREPLGRLAFDFTRTRCHVHAVLGQVDAAVELAQELLPMARALTEPRWMAWTLGNLAGRLFAYGYTLKVEEGRIEAGLTALERSVRVGREAVQAVSELGALRLNLSNLNNLAGALAALGRDDEALEVSERHDALALQLQLDVVRPNALLNHARVLWRRGDAVKARGLAETGLALCPALGATKMSALLHQLLSEMDEHAGELHAALAHYKHYHEQESRAVSETAALRSRLLAVRLRTEQALQDAARERERAEALRQANEQLAREAARRGHEALHDALTDLPNRRGMRTLLIDRHERARASGAPSSLAMIDVDQFKRINDQHGHAVGDRVLQALAATLRAHCRGSDIASRWGGEEFVVAFGGVSSARGVAACERLRQAVHGCAWDAVAPGLAVTVSIGVVDLAGYTDVDEALAAADAMMYLAKAAGRNRVAGDAEAAAPR